MAQQFNALAIATVPAGTMTMTPEHTLPETVALTSPAIDVMTDLARITAVSVSPNDSIDDANTRMKNRGVRLLLVLADDGVTLGIITARDIEGNRATAVVHQLGIARREVLVRDVMTPRHQMEAMWMSDVAKAAVGDVIETLKLTGRQHAVVMEKAVDGTRLRGLFSSMQIGRQLGVHIEKSGVASTFSELESALTA